MKLKSQIGITLTYYKFVIEINVQIGVAIIYLNIMLVKVSLVIQIFICSIDTNSKIPIMNLLISNNKLEL